MTHITLTYLDREGALWASCRCVAAAAQRSCHVHPDGPDIVESQATTPFLDDADNAPVAETAHQLRLTFDKPPKDIGRGACDVSFAPKRRQYGISEVHFYIIFDEEGRLVLEGKPTHGSSVSYDGWGQEHKRHMFMWILFPNKTIQVHLANNFTLEIVLPKRHQWL
jgi:hypothetical protein